MSSRWRRFWLAAGLLSGLSLVAALSLTVLHGHIARQLLREQISQLGPRTRLALELRELSGGLFSSCIRLALQNRSWPQTALLLEADFSHRLLTTRFSGHLRLDPGSAGTPSPLADLKGLVRIALLARRHDWSVQLLGQPLELAFDGKRLELARWSAYLQAPKTAHLTLDLPRLRLAGPSGQRLGVEGVKLELKLASGSLDGRLRLAGVELRVAPILLASKTIRLKGQLQREPAGWFLALHAGAAELVYQGVPFTRLRDLRHQSQAQLSATPGLTGDLAWRGRQHLTASSDYGVLTLEMAAEGQARLPAGLELTQARLTGELPQGHWQLLERLTPALATQLRDAGLVQTEARLVRLQARYRGGAWGAVEEMPPDTH